MSSASQANIDRWNTYNSLKETARLAVICATQFLVRPTEGFPTYYDAEIESAWRKWRDAEEAFWRITDASSPPTRIFPAMPAADAEKCCFQMWGLLIQVQVDGTHGSTELLRQTVEQIVANEKCQSHPATCPCHVPENPWVYKEDVDALAPINPRHNPKCGCAGWNRCASREMAAAAAAAAVRAKQDADAAMAEQQAQNMAKQVARVELETRRAEEAFLRAPPPVYSSPYTHNVDTCACGNCHKSRVDSGTSDAYMRRCREASDAAMARLSAKGGSERLQRQESYQPAAAAAGGGGGILGAAVRADVAIMRATKACGGSTDHPDFAKNLFAAMGTPHDSTCPHGLPFYACMPCSH